jgi:hypothetical protein
MNYKQDVRERKREGERKGKEECVCLRASKQTNKQEKRETSLVICPRDTLSLWWVAEPSFSMVARQTNREVAHGVPVEDGWGNSDK